MDQAQWDKLSPEEQDKALKDDYRNSVLRYLRSEQEECPTGLDFPELTDQEMAQLSLEAKAEFDAGKS